MSPSPEGSLTPSTVEQAYEGAACALLTIDADGLIARVNETLLAWTGFVADELLGRRFQSLLSVGSKLFHQTHWAPLLEIQGSVAEVQLEILHKDRRALPVLVNALRRQPSAPSGRAFVDVALFIAADRRKYERELIASRRRAEELLERAREAEESRALAEARLRLALDSVDLRVWSARLPGGERQYEPGVAALIGRPDLSAVSPEMYAAHMTQDDRCRDEAMFAAALDSERRAIYSLEYSLLGEDGVVRVVCSTGRAFFGDDGRAVQFSGVIEDITVRRRAEEALRAAEADAQQRATLAEQLVGIVSHDLRNPLNAVMLGAHLLVAADLGPHARIVRRILSSAERADRLITDLLDFTQARLGGGLRVARREVDLHAVVSESLDEVKMAWPGRMIEHRRIGEGAGEVDPDRIAQVVTNLVNNALVYGAPTEPVILSTLVGSSALEIRVHNGGPPISNELIAHIFEPLRRGEQQVRLGSRSVGLGLYIVREIAAAHGGLATVQSSPDEGTTFVVSIPRAAAPAGSK